MSLESPLTVWLYVCFAKLQSLFSAWGPTVQEKAVHLDLAQIDLSLNSNAYPCPASIINTVLY